MLAYYTAATEHNTSWYKAWHALAYMNYEAVLFYKNRGNVQQSAGMTEKSDSGATVSSPVALVPMVPMQKQSSVATPYVFTYAVPAVQGFFKSIALSSGSSLQDTLRLLTLWFDYGQWPDVYEAIVEGLKTIQIETWLQVIFSIVHVFKCYQIHEQYTALNLRGKHLSMS